MLSYEPVPELWLALTYGIFELFRTYQLFILALTINAFTMGTTTLVTFLLYVHPQSSYAILLTCGFWIVNPRLLLGPSNSLDLGITLPSHIP